MDTNTIKFLLDLATINRDLAQEEMQKADKALTKLVKAPKTFKEYTVEYFTPIIEKLKTNNITHEEAEQLTLLSSEDVASANPVVATPALLKLHNLVEPLVSKDISSIIQTLSPKQIKKYAASQADYGRALIQYAACLVIINTLEPIQDNYTQYSQQNIINLTIEKYKTFIPAEENGHELSSFFKADILNAINSFYEFAFETQQNTTANLPIIINSIVPKSFIMDNTKLANHLHKLDTTQTNELKIATKSNQEICITAEISNVQGLENLNTFDIGVLNSVYTAWRSGADCFTTDQLFKILSGSKRGRGEYVLLDDIDNSMKKLMSTIATIDCTQQADLYPKLKGGKTVIGGNLINAKFMENARYSNGREVKTTTYKVIDKPILLDYAEKLNQVASYPQKLLEHDLKKIRPTKNNISIRMALLSFLTIGTNTTKPQNKISLSLDTIFEKACITFDTKNEATAKTQRQRTREAVFNILDHLKENKAILKYEPYKKGKAIIGVTITLKHPTGIKQ